MAALLHASPALAAAIGRQRRQRGKQERDEARRVLVSIYGVDIPGPPWKAVCNVVRPHLQLAMDDRTIIRAGKDLRERI